METIEYKQENHVKNLDVALGIIRQVGVVYNTLDRKEILNLMVERVTVNASGKAQVKLRTPFAYLNTVSKRVQRHGEIDRNASTGETKIGKDNSADSSKNQILDWLLCCGRDRIRTVIAATR